MKNHNSSSTVQTTSLYCQLMKATCFDQRRPSSGHRNHNAILYYAVWFAWPEDDQPWSEHVAFNKLIIIQFNCVNGILSLEETNGLITKQYISYKVQNSTPHYLKVNFVTARPLLQHTVPNTNKLIKYWSDSLHFSDTTENVQQNVAALDKTD